MEGALGREGATRKPWHPLPRSGLAPHTFFQFKCLFLTQPPPRPPQFTKTRDLVPYYLVSSFLRQPGVQASKQAIREAGIVVVVHLTRPPTTSYLPTITRPPLFSPPYSRALRLCLSI